MIQEYFKIIKSFIYFLFFYKYKENFIKKWNLLKKK